MGPWARKAALAIVVALCPLAVSAEQITIAALGDSLTHGYGLPASDGLVPQLDRWLSAEGLDVSVINAGVSGDTTAGGRARLAWTLSPEVDALIVALGANDMLRGIPPEDARANLDAILTEADARDLPVLLIGFQAAGNFGPDYKAAFDAIYPDLAAAHGAALVPSFFAPLRAADDGTPAARARLLQPDGLHPTAEGVALIVESLGPAVIAWLAPPA